jgi:cyclic dehypoxanthinyl futalosine synthase
MIEENVVSVAGAKHRFTANGIQRAIKDAGFQPRLRDQQYQYRELPAALKDQVLEGAGMIVD